MFSFLENFFQNIFHLRKYSYLCSLLFTQEWSQKGAKGRNIEIIF
jgi:hypothetical protein